MDSEAAFKCDDNGLESLLAGYVVKGSVHWKGGCNVNDSSDAIFFILSLKLLRISCLIHH